MMLMIIFKRNFLFYLSVVLEADLFIGNRLESEQLATSIFCRLSLVME